MTAWIALAAAVAASATGFDHVIHEGRVVGAGLDDIPCARCHAVDRRGRLVRPPDHTACFGACHGEPPRRGRVPARLSDARRPVCAACHAPDALAAYAAGRARRLPAAYPPYVIAPDYTLRLSHRTHAAARCTDCHRTGGPPHRACARCHAAGTAPPMTACADCHQPAFGPAVGPVLSRGPFPVTGAFDHARHARAAGAADCTACHAAVRDADGDAIPAPRTADCAPCHDGRTAFATTAHCRRCHRPASARPARAPREPFSHAAHAGAAALACADCHRLGAGGMPAPVAPDHQPCARADCHADDFASPQPRTCGACHVGDEPWRALAWFPPRRARSEFGARMPHASHPGVRACDRCHAPHRGRQPVLAGHRACSDSACHGGGAPPAMAACDGCHALGRAAARDRAAAAEPWSVRARFRHAGHDGACDACHRIDATAPEGVAAPAKAACAPCHDGVIAFKMTGHGCKRCHGK
ncbi:MAG: hypothetical protein D6689_04305 [Deltaproteobacteria bacterium]|nr:MAG: hypothetical protein D6689_04305 [Deltaproteobacteria bacterium]